jgi:metal-responsive CopG/Arc/MetJ family transcriptional regulator
VRQPNETRVYIPFAPDELEEIDKWGFEKHIRARSEVVRQLVWQGLRSEQCAKHNVLARQ